MTLIASYVVPLNTPSGAGSYQGEFYVWLNRQDVSTNTSVVGWEFAIRKLTGSGRWSTETNNWAVVVNGNIVDFGNLQYDFRNYAYLTVSSGEVTVAHGTNGDKAINAYANFDDDADNLQVFSIGNSNPTGITLTSIARATLPVVSPNPAVEGGTATITLNRAVGTYAHDLTWVCGSKSGTIATGVATSTTWTVPTDLVEEYPDRESAPVVITAVTKNGGDTIGSRSATLMVREEPGPPVVGGEDFPFDLRVKEVVYTGGVWGPTRTYPVQTVQLVDPHSATGTCKFDVSRLMADEIEDFSVVDVQVHDGVQWLNPGHRFVVTRVEEDATELSRTVAFSGMDFMDYSLARAYTQKDYEWESTTPGNILVTLINDAKARGWGPRVDIDFTASVTSFDTPWTETNVKREVKKGTPISQVLEGLVNDGLVEYRPRYRANKAWLEVLNPGTGSDWSTFDANPIVNLATVPLTTAPRRSTNEEQVTRITVAGDGEVQRTRERPPFDADVFGQLEGWVAAGGVTDNSEADRIGDNALDDASKPVDERTFAFEVHAVPRQVWPYFSVRPGDWVLIPQAVTEGTERARVGQITIDKNADGKIEATLLTGERILNGTAALAKRQQIATGGATPGGSLRPPVTLDERIPAAPLIDSISSTGYWDSDGAARSTVTLAWDPVVTSISGSALPVNYYEIWWRPNVATPWAMRTVTDQTIIDMPDWNINFAAQFRVRGRSDAGVFGQWSDFVDHTTNQPAPSLGAPTIPTVTTNALGMITVAWDGEIDSDPAPPYLAYIRAEISDDGDAPWSVFGTPLMAAGETSIDPGVYRTWYLRLVPVDRLGQDGTPSSAVSITTVDPGLDPRVPKAPTGLTSSTDSGWDDDGLTRFAWIDLEWDAVTEDVNDDPITVSHYEVWGRLDTETEYRFLGGTVDTEFRVEPLVPGSDWVFVVQALSETGVRGPFSSSITETADTPPNEMLKPTTPVLASSKGLLNVQWDGLLGGVAPPPSFRYVYAEYSVAGENTWVRAGVTFTRGGGDIFISLVVGEDYDVRLTAVGGDGGESPKSDIATETVVGVASNDLNAILETMLTEPRIETSPDPAEGVKLFNGGIVAYDSNGDPTVVISSEDGSIYFAEGMISGNAIVTGSILADKLDVGTLVATLISSSLGDSLNLSSNESVNIIVGDAMATVQDNIDGVDADLSELMTYYQFNNDGALITSPGSPFAVQITNSQINMIANGNIVSYWNAGNMVVPSLIANDTAIIGAHQWRKEGVHTTVRAL